MLDRLALFARTSDGFELAEADLLARGGGQLFGERQSGSGDLEVASLVRDRKILEEAREEAQALLPLLPPLGHDPRLTITGAASSARFGDKVEWVKRA